MARDDLLKPILKKFGHFIGDTADFIGKPFCKIWDWYWDLPNAGLFFCGFCFIFVTLIAIYLAVFLAVILTEIVVFFVLANLIGLAFTLIGIWPAFICTFGVTGITIIRLPTNVYRHYLVTYRTVMLTRSLKLFSFFLIPIIHIFVPIVTFFICICSFLPVCAVTSFWGYPLEPWDRIRKVHQYAWTKFATQVDQFAENYGHWSGIPENWNGTIYGLAFDPIMIVLSIFTYFIGVIPVSIAVFIIFTIKAIPIFLGTLVEFWKSISIFKSAIWYWKVLAGQHEPNTSSGINNRNQDVLRTTGHDSWLKGVKKATKGIKKFIEGYSKIKLWKSYTSTIENYFKSIKCIKPSKLCDLVKSYCTDFSPTKVIPEDIGCSILLLWFPILMVIIMWSLGFVLVLVIPPITFVTTFIFWIMLWPIVLVFQPVGYVVGWIAIIFGLPVLYVLLWCMILILPWIFSLMGSISGPFLALKIPGMMMKYNYHNPIGELFSFISFSESLP